MHAEEQPLATDLPAAHAIPMLGARWALTLGAVLIVALALLTAMRWLGRSSASVEEVVQIPVPADAAATTPPRDKTAPDPGDHP